MIRTVRRILVALLNSNTRLTDEMLHTVFCEVECIVNSRPITKCSDDVQDVAALTPNHLLLLRDNQAAPGVYFMMMILIGNIGVMCNILLRCFGEGG